MGCWSFLAKNMCCPSGKGKNNPKGSSEVSGAATTRGPLGHRPGVSLLGTRGLGCHRGLRGLGHHAGGLGGQNMKPKRIIPKP